MTEEYGEVMGRGYLSKTQRIMTKGACLPRYQCGIMGDALAD